MTRTVHTLLISVADACKMAVCDGNSVSTDFANAWKDSRTDAHRSGGQVNHTLWTRYPSFNYESWALLQTFSEPALERFKLRTVKIFPWCSSKVTGKAIQRSFSTLTNTPSRGVSVAPANMGKGCWVSGHRTSLYFLKIPTNVVLTSIWANRIPMQVRGPDPKGMKWRGWRDSFAGLRNLSGSNFSGSGHATGSRWIE